MRRAVQGAAFMIEWAQRSIMSGNNGLSQTVAWRTQRKLCNQRRFCRGWVSFCERKVWLDVSILICVWSAVFFVECGFLSFVASHPLAPVGHLKDRDLCVWKSGKDAQKLTINNEFHVKHSDG